MKKKSHSSKGFRSISSGVISIVSIFSGLIGEAHGSENSLDNLARSDSSYNQCIRDTPSNISNAAILNDRITLVHDLRQCLENFSSHHFSKTNIDKLHTQLEEATDHLTSSRKELDTVDSQLKKLEDQAFSSTTKLTGLTVLGAQYGDSVGDRPLIRPISGETLQPSRPSAIGISFFSLNTSFSGNDLLKTTIYTANRGEELLTRAQIGNSQSNKSINTFFIPSRTVWSLVPSSFNLYRLSYQFKPASDLTITMGPKFFPTDIVDKNTYTNPITSFNSWAMINNSLITPYEIRLIGGAGAGLDWNIGGGPFSLRGVYIARRGNIATSQTDQGGLFNAPYQGTAELEYRDRLGEGKYIVTQLQYTHSDTSGIEQDVIGLNTELGLGKVGLFGRFGYSWAEADAGINPLPFSPGDANSFQTSLFQVGVAIKDVGLDRSLLSVGIGQPFRTTLNPPPDIPKRFQTNVEAFYRIPINQNLYLAPTLLAVFNPNNRGDQPTLLQGFLRFTILY